MPLADQVNESIFRAIEDINLQLPEGQRLEKSLGTMLYGREGALDSLGLVNLIVAVEQHLLDDFKLTVKLDDEHALAHPSNVFISAESLSRYIQSRLQSR